MFLTMVNVTFSFILGAILSAFLYGGNLKLSDAFLAVVVGLVIEIIYILRYLFKQKKVR